MERNLYFTQAVLDQSLFDRLNKLRRKLGFEPIDRTSNFENSVWIILDNKSKTDLGYIRIVPHSDNDREIGFVLLPDFRGQKVMSHVLPDFVKDLNEHLYSETSEENEAAIKILMKSGFVPTEAKTEFHTTPSGQQVRTIAFRYLGCII